MCFYIAEAPLSAAADEITRCRADVGIGPYDKQDPPERLLNHSVIASQFSNWRGNPLTFLAIFDAFSFYLGDCHAILRDGSQ